MKINPKVITLPKHTDRRGNLSFIEENTHVPFDIKRVYYLYDMPAGAERGAHGHKALEQLIIPLSGSFEIILDNGKETFPFFLKKPWEGLYVPPMYWRELKEFSSGAVCMVLASEKYDENDYFRDYAEFKKAALCN